MAFLIYFLLPLGGSLLLQGAMFYGAYRIAGRPRPTLGGIGLAVVFSLTGVGFSVLGNTWVNLLFAVIMFPFVARWVFRASRAAIVPYFILSAAVFLADAVVISGMQFLLVTGMLSLNAVELGYILQVFCARMAEFMVILLVSLAAEKRTEGHVALRQVLLSILLPAFSLFNLYAMVYLLQIFFTLEGMVLLVLDLGMLIGLNIYFCLLVDTIGKNHRLEVERNLYRQQALQYQYHERQEEKYEASRKLIHDIRNHIQAMEALYSREGAMEAARYAGDIQRMLNQFGQKYYTSEKLLNLILNDKAEAMRQAGVREDIKVGELSLDFMESTDVTALFANLLDNAIAAAATSRERYVRLRVGEARQFVSIVMENGCDNRPRRKGSGFYSRKPGHEGLGLEIIQRTVARYGGDVSFEWREGVFYTRVLLGN